MDPNLFRIDYEVLGEILITIIVLAFLVERALSIVFEHRWFVSRFNDRGLKEPIAFLVSLAVVWHWQFDALGTLLHADQASRWGYVITAAVIAGGSKASIKLFQDLMNVKSTAKREQERVRAAATPGAVK